MMALTRGGQAKRPCPICLVPDEELSALSLSYPLRSVEETHQTFAETRELTKTQQTSILAAQGIRNVEVLILHLSKQ